MFPPRGHMGEFRPVMKKGAKGKTHTQVMAEEEVTETETETEEEKAKVEEDIREGDAVEMAKEMEMDVAMDTEETRETDAEMTMKSNVCAHASIALHGVVRLFFKLRNRHLSQLSQFLISILSMTLK